MVPKSTLIFALLLLSVCYPALSASRGKIILKNGHTLSGDITRNTDGSIWITMKSGSVRFEKNEVRRVVVTSTNDHVHETFMASFRSTPPRRAASIRTTVTPYDALIDAEAKKNSLDPALIKAVIKAESNFKVDDRSSKGACGLMQIMPDTARIMGIRSVYSPCENIRAGTRFLRDMLYQFGGDTDLALAAYNAGPATVRRYGTVPPYRETRSYIANVNRYYRDYRGRGSICAYTDSAGCLNLSNVR